MYDSLARDLANLDPLLEQVRQQALAVLASLDERPVAMQPAARAASALPMAAVGLSATLERFARDLQLCVFQNAAAYLGLPGDNPDFVHLTPENSRRLRALATWFALAAYGREGHAEIVQRNIRLAQQLGERIDALPGLQRIAPVRLNVVCFTLADDPSEARVQAFVRAVRDGGEAFVTPTVYGGVWAVRAAFSNWRTTASDLDRITAALASACAAADA